VDVGNTTNTQFYVEITGWETGKGSTTAFGGYFTVFQKADAPTKPATNPTNPPTGSTIYYPGTTRTMSPIYYRTPTPKPTPKPLTVYSIRWTEIFWFEGCMTTDLSKVTDPKNVTNFTIDTKYGWMMTYEETLNLTDTNRLKTLRDIDKYWVVESWFIWIKVEWWEVYKEPAVLTLQNDNLTGFAPQVKVTEAGNKKIEEVVTLKENKKGEVRAEVKGAGKITIEPKVEFTQDEYQTSDHNVDLSLKSSHQNLTYFLKINDQDRLTEVKNFNNDTGEFKVLAKNLDRQENLAQIYYQEGDKPMVLADETTIKIVPWWQSMIKPVIFGFLGGLVLGVSSYLGYKNRRKLATLPKHLKKIVKKFHFKKR